VAKAHNFENSGEVPLTGVLAEFRSALRSEIEAAKRNEAGSAVALINGRRIGHVAGRYQYIFDLENVLSLPGEAPGDLYVPNREPLEVMVTSVDGMAITISVPENIGAVDQDDRHHDLAAPVRGLDFAGGWWRGHYEHHAGIGDVTHS
jgi:hypothetical protein